jgi:drug/metabolite transporter superfamily protein YnfA
MESSMRVHDARVSPLTVAADRVGATASFLCAVHCALLPFVIALLPLLGLGFLADHRFERIFVACAAALASITIVTAWRRHRKLHALFLLVPGIALLLAGILIDIEHREWTHTVLVVCGGVLVASAHVVNLVLSHRHVHTAHCGHIV